MKDFTLRQSIISYILKIIIVVSATIGVILSAVARSSTFMGGASVFMYFTIQSNIAIALIALIGGVFIFTKKYSYAWYVIKLVGTVSITLTGVVFCFVLAPTLGNGAWTLINILTHVIVPIASIIDFFVVGINNKYRKRELFYIVIPPLLYAIYAGIGFALNWKFSSGTNYPYFFLNWGSEAGAFGFSSNLPFMGVVYWILILLIGLIGVGLLYVFIVNKLRKKFKID